MQRQGIILDTLNKGGLLIIFFKKMWYKAIKASNWTVLFATISLIMISSFAITFIEPDTFPTPFEGLWWVMTTVVTVGYGDVSPTTIEGKIFAMFLYIVGIGIMTIFIGKTIDAFSYRKRLKEEGKMKITTENHIILINWTKKAQIALEELLITFPSIHIVIIDEILEKTPIFHERVEFVKGNPSVHETLCHANVVNCKSVMIFSPEDCKRTSEADGQTLLIASTLKEYARKQNQTIYTLCEISDTRHLQAFQYVDVDEFITPNDTAAHLAARSMLFNGSSEIIRQLTSHKGYDLYSIPNKGWKTYRQAKDELSSKGALLISDHEDLSIVNRLDESIPVNAKLFVICDEQAYEIIKKT
ncbi:ion channel [Bacillus carboniphilus]|uniref:Ion channel n=1 Tax=Bacillus carboniphilus TaxID=86663 RepID=A0ABY9JWV0_9BACI|nr:potassium channel family protein [Bacillus carboniphilus]WLR43274.1 ion channel [Bacillus carboniphilus]